MKTSKKCTYNLDDITEEYKRKWPQHISGMNDTGTPKLLYEYIPPGKRQAGRPRKRWRGQHNTPRWLICSAVAADAEDGNRQWEGHNMAAT